MALQTVKVDCSGDVVEVPEAILTLSSPVFKAMLETDMKEARERVIRLPGKSKEEFEVFAQFLEPFSLMSREVNKDNVDFLLEWSNEYDVPPLKKLCEEYLLTKSATAARMLQAHRCQLKRQRKRCIQEVGQTFETQQGLAQVLEEEPSLLAELLPEMRSGKVRKVEEAHEAQAKLRTVRGWFGYCVNTLVPLLGDALNSKLPGVNDTVQVVIGELKREVERTR